MLLRYRLPNAPISEAVCTHTWSVREQRYDHPVIETFDLTGHSAQYYAQPAFADEMKP